VARIRIQPDAIHGICKQLDISREELARRLGVSSSATFRVDSGRVTPSPKFIAALMTVSGKPFEDLFEVVVEEPAA
jgi:transcriptional regulator with XRE-family HTH domain